MAFRGALSGHVLGFLLVGGLLLSACDVNSTQGNRSADSLNLSDFDIENCALPTDRLISGGVGRDGIRSLDQPSLVESEAESAEYLADSSRVIGLLFGDKPLAVPLPLLWYHEIANFDDWGGESFAVTHCPLTGSSLVLDRDAVDGAEFGVSGLLFDNNLVMYDRRAEESLWPQMNRQAGCGAATGTELSMLPSIEMTWGRWKALHPDTRVLPLEDFDEVSYPYGNYRAPQNERLLFEGTPIDDRRPPKERVLGIPVESGEKHGRSLALPFGALDDGSAVRVVTVTVDSTAMTVFWSRKAQGAMAYETSTSFSVEDGRIVDDATGSVWTVDGRAVVGFRKGDRLEPVNDAYVAFWFAWAAFHPDTRLWTPPS
ncbi:MAG: DUF3179 domain-containing protein [Salinibacter sp.]|uniref:DUF3179 domain-containing protein n=1 Tax=Salinibacter sp. TaxID=2065818 RepID=UPI0035D441E4